MIVLRLVSSDCYDVTSKRKYGECAGRERDEYSVHTSVYSSSDGERRVCIGQMVGISEKWEQFIARGFIGKENIFVVTKENDLGVSLCVAGWVLGEAKEEERVELSEKGRALLSSIPYLSSLGVVLGERR
jgi:hypothetical protein